MEQAFILTDKQNFNKQRWQKLHKGVSILQSTNKDETKHQNFLIRVFDDFY